MRYLRKEPLQPDDFVEARLSYGNREYPVFVAVAGIVDPTPAPKPSLPQGKPPPPKPPPPKQPQGKPQPLAQGPGQLGGQPRPLPQPPGKVVQPPPQSPEKPQRPPRPDKPTLQPQGREFQVLEHSWTKPLPGEQGGVGMIGPGATVRVVDPAFDPADTAWIGKDVRIVVQGVERLMPAKALMPKVTT